MEKLHWCTVSILLCHLPWFPCKLEYILTAVWEHGFRITILLRNEIGKRKWHGSKRAEWDQFVSNLPFQWAVYVLYLNCNLFMWSKHWGYYIMEKWCIVHQVLCERMCEATVVIKVRRLDIKLIQCSYSVVIRLSSETKNWGRTGSLVMILMSAFNQHNNYYRITLNIENTP